MPHWHHDSHTPGKRAEMQPRAGGTWEVDHKNDGSSTRLPQRLAGISDDDRRDWDQPTVYTRPERPSARTTLRGVTAEINEAGRGLNGDLRRGLNGDLRRADKHQRSAASENYACNTDFAHFSRGTKYGDEERRRDADEDRQTRNSEADRQRDTDRELLRRREVPRDREREGDREEERYRCMMREKDKQREKEREREMQMEMDRVRDKELEKERVLEMERPRAWDSGRDHERERYGHREDDEGRHMRVRSDALRKREWESYVGRRTEADHLGRSRPLQDTRSSPRSPQAGPSTWALPHSAAARGSSLDSGDSDRDRDRDRDQWRVNSMLQADRRPWQDDPGMLRADKSADMRDMKSKDMAGGAGGFLQEDDRLLRMRHELQHSPRRLADADDYHPRQGDPSMHAAKRWKDVGTEGVHLHVYGGAKAGRVSDRHSYGDMSQRRAPRSI